VDDKNKRNKVKVIVVDDGSIHLKVWEKVFRRLNCCDYCLTNDPKMAAKLAAENPVDLLISEVIMENANGFDLAENIHRSNPRANIILTTTYNCDLKRFNLENPRFHILYKPYHSIDEVIKFVANILQHADPRTNMDEDSWSENEEFPSIMEWKL